MSLASFSMRPKKAGRIPQWQMALLLIAVGILGRLLLWNLPNVETVMVVALLAGALLGGFYVILVPVVVMASSDAVIYVMGWSGPYSPFQVVGLGLFLYSGFVAAAAMGTAMRRRILFRTRTLAVMTTISIPATLLYDAWTAFGDWLLISRNPPWSWSLQHVFEMQLPFTLVHIASSLIFVPIFGTMFIYLHTHGWPSVEPTSTPAEPLGRP